MPNRDQLNVDPLTGLPDGDCVGTACDNSPGLFNTDQADLDNDGVGDVCDSCVARFDVDQIDADSCPPYGTPDGVGDSCDNWADECNPLQSDIDFDGVGDECDICPQAAIGSDGE